MYKETQRGSLSALYKKRAFFSYSPFSHTSCNASCLPPISPGYYTRPKRNRRQWLCKILGS